AFPHTGIESDVELRHMLGKVGADSSPQFLFFLLMQPTDSTVVLSPASNKFCGILRYPSILHTKPEYQREERLVPVCGCGLPVVPLGLRAEPALDVQRLN